MTDGPAPRGPDTRVQAHLRRLDRDALASFVADLYAARGYGVDSDGGTLSLTDADGAAPPAAGDGTTVAVVGARGLLRRRASLPAGADPDPDVVVAADPDRAASLAERVGARPLAAGDLLEMARYGAPPGTLAELCDRHLGAAPAGLAPPRGQWLRSRVGAVTGAASPLAAVAVVVVLVGALTVPAFVGAGPDGGGAVPAFVGVGPDGGETGPANGTEPPDEEVATERPWPSGTVAGGGAVPGVGTDGIENVSRLATAHEAALAGESYTLWADVYRPRNRTAGNERVQYDVDMLVAGDRYTVTETEVAGAERTRRHAVYHDGETTYVAEGPPENATYERLGPDGYPPPSAPDPRTLTALLVETYLDAPETALAGRADRRGRSYYEVVARGAPAGFDYYWISDYEARALVAPSGLVADVVVRYTVNAEEGSFDVRLEYSYGGVGSTRVSPPAWYREAFANGSARVGPPKRQI